MIIQYKNNYHPLIIILESYQKADKQEFLRKNAYKNLKKLSGLLRKFLVME